MGVGPVGCRQQGCGEDAKQVVGLRGLDIRFYGTADIDGDSAVAVPGRFPIRWNFLYWGEFCGNGFYLSFVELMHRISLKHYRPDCTQACCHGMSTGPENRMGFKHYSAPACC